MPVGGDMVIVGIRSLRGLVKILHVGVGRSAVKVEVVFFDVFAVIAFGIGKSKETLLEDRIFPVPQCQGKTENLMVVRDAGKAIFSPAIGARAGLVMGEISPGVSTLAVIFADGAPLTLTEIGAPLLPFGTGLGWL